MRSNDAWLTPSAFGFVLHSLALSLIVLVSGCTGPTRAVHLPPAASNVLRIVSSLPTRGTSAYQGQLMAQAVDLAIEKRGAEVGGWRIEHVKLDGSASESGDWSVAAETENATQAANDPSVIAYLGPYTSGATGVALPITNRAGLLQLGPSATWPGLTRTGWNDGEPGKYHPGGERTFVRLMPDDSRLGAAAASWAASLSIQRILVLSDGSSYSDGIAKEFATSARQSGLAIAGSVTVNLNDPGGLAGKVDTSAAGGLFYAPSSPGSAVLVANALANNLPVFAVDTALSDQFAEAAGDSAQNWYIVSNGMANMVGNSRWDEFSSSFQGKYAQEPTQFAGNAYDLTNMVLDAVAEGAGRDRKSVRERVFQVKDYHGVTGTINFDEAGDVRSARMSGYRLIDGKFALDRVIELPR